LSTSVANSITFGRIAHSGKVTVSTLFFTSLITVDVSASSSNVNRTVETHKELVDSTFLIHFIPSISFSIFSVMSESTSIGFDQTETVVIISLQKLIFGVDSFGIKITLTDQIRTINSITKKLILHFETQKITMQVFLLLVQFCSCSA
jgi:hypothetical protein